MRSPSRGEQGSVSAEFAAIVPAVMLVLVMCLSVLQAGVMQVRLQDAAADAARIVARGEGIAAAEAHARALVPRSSITVQKRGSLECVRVTGAAAGAGPLAGVSLAATGCALGDGR